MMKRLVVLSIAAVTLLGIDEGCNSGPAVQTPSDPMLACHISSTELIGNRTKYIGEVFEVTEENIHEHCDHDDQSRIRAGLKVGDRCAFMDNQLRPCRVRTEALVARPPTAY